MCKSIVGALLSKDYLHQFPSILGEPNARSRRFTQRDKAIHVGPIKRKPKELDFYFIIVEKL